MKKIVALFCAAALCGAMCGCSGAENGGDSEKLSVVTTIFPAYDFARRVFGDTAEIILLLKPGMEIHGYDPSAKDIVKIDGCDLFIYNGGESDAWVDSILDAADDVETFRMMDCVDALDEELSEGMEAENEKEGDDEEAEYDEHIWTSPKNAAKIVEGLKQAACELAPDSADAYISAADSYIDDIEDLDKKFEELLDGEERYFVFGDRFPLLYFFREYELYYYAAFPGCGSETEPSAQTVTFLLDKLDSDGAVKAVFYIELSSHKLADTLANEKGLPEYEFHTCHNISAEDFEAGETWVSLMTRNYDMLKTVLGR